MVTAAPADAPIRVLINPAQVSCEPELPGLVLDFRTVWELADMTP